MEALNVNHEYIFNTVIFMKYKDSGCGFTGGYMSLRQSDKRAPPLTTESETVLISPWRYTGRVKEQV